MLSFGVLQCVEGWGVVAVLPPVGVDWVQWPWGTCGRLRGGVVDAGVVRALVTSTPALKREATLRVGPRVQCMVPATGAR